MLTNGCSGGLRRCAANPSPGTVFPINEDALVLALRHLVENAVIHGPDQAEVIVDATGSGNSIGFYVEDSGRGLSADEAEACTQPFIRGDRTSGPGSGLGLAIASAALRNAGMTLRFEQLRPTGFRVTAVHPERALLRPVSAKLAAKPTAIFFITDAPSLGRDPS